jgi:hypothetical protein
MKKTRAKTDTDEQFQQGHALKRSHSHQVGIIDGRKLQSKKLWWPLVT